MKAIVVNEGNWKPSVSGRGQNKRVTFEVLDSNPKKYVYLNITDYEFDTAAKQTMVDKWVPNCKNGNVIDLPLLNESTVNKFGQFTVTKRV